MFREMLLLLLLGIGGFYFSLLLAFFILPTARASKIIETVVSGLSVIFGVLFFQFAQIAHAPDVVTVDICLGSMSLGNSLLVLKAKWLAIVVLIMLLLELPGACLSSIFN